MRRIILVLAVCVLALGGNAQINKYGNPFITCYPPEVYNAEDQNWAIVQDNRGFIYVANYQAVLEYDGITWRSIEIPNTAYIYSLALGDDGVLYVGATNQFGYIAPDSIGNLAYNSLSEQVPDSFQEFMTLIIITARFIIARMSTILFIPTDNLRPYIKNQI